MIFACVGSRPVGSILSLLGTGYSNTTWFQVGGADPATWIAQLRRSSHTAMRKSRIVAAGIPWASMPRQACTHVVSQSFAA